MVTAAFVYMRRVGLREFNRNFYKQIQSLPFIVTKNKQPHLLVMPYPADVENIDEANLYIVDPAQFEMKSDTMPSPTVNSGTPPVKTSLLEKIKKLLVTKII